MTLNYTIGYETLNTQLFNMTTQFKISTPGEEPFHFGHKLSSAFVCFASVCFLIIIIVAVICNSILVATIVSIRNLHTSVNIFIVNLAVGDLITAIGTIPFDVEYLIRGYFFRGAVACGIMQTTFFISLPSSVLCLTLITAERFITIVFSLQEIVTKRRVLISIIIMWIYALITATFPIMYDKKAVGIKNGICYLKFPLGYQIFQLSANFSLPIIFIIAVYTKLFLVSYKHANKDASIANRMGIITHYIDHRNRESLITEETMARKRKVTTSAKMSRNLKASKRIGILVSVFLLCWLPYIVLAAFNYICQCLPREMTWVANIINYSSTALNPLLYGLLSKQIRNELWKRGLRLRSRLSDYWASSRNGKSACLEKSV